MPAVHCIVERKDKRQLVDLIFPVRTSSSARPGRALALA
jgi:hypothetical protein